jgi:hypothetical protein
MRPSARAPVAGIREMPPKIAGIQQDMTRDPPPQISDEACQNPSSN